MTIVNFMYLPVFWLLLLSIYKIFFLLDCVIYACLGIPWKKFLESPLAPWPSLSFFQLGPFFSLLASVDLMDLDLCIRTSNTWEEDVENGTIVALLAAFKHFGHMLLNCLYCQSVMESFGKI